MKKLILFLLLLTGIASAQLDVNGGYYWTDSLWNAILVDTSATPDDTTAASTTALIPLNFQYEWLSIVAVDTGATITDSIRLEYGTVRFVPDTINAGIPYMRKDTVWASVHFLRDSTWTNVNLISGANSQSTYKADVADYEVVRLRMVNATLTEDRVWKFYAVLSRKK